MLRFSLPLLPASLANMVVHASDRYFVREFISLSETGIYTLGYKIGNSIHSLFYVSFSQIWNARRYAIEQDPGAGLIYAKICTYFTVLMSFVGLGLSLFSQEIIR
jgi:O-antigen/teichoic acid export membrane protein